MPGPVMVGGGVWPQLGVFPPPGVSGDEGLGHAGQRLEQLTKRPPGVATTAVPGLVCMQRVQNRVRSTLTGYKKKNTNKFDMQMR